MIATSDQLANIVGALRAYGTPQAGDDSPNPILGTAPAPDGGTIRVYRDGMLDAIDGSFYSVSPGFSDVDELVSWIEEEQRSRRNTERLASAGRALGDLPIGSYDHGEDDAAADRRDALPGMGARVRLVRCVDRYPHFLVEAGATGVVVHTPSGDPSGTYCVRMDEHVDGAEDWENEIVWSVGDGDDPSLDVELVNEEGSR